MAKDFREYLVESSRHEEFGRFFKEIAIGSKLVVSFQASKIHSCNPEETLDDIYAYEGWEVAIRQVKPAIDVPRAGAWGHLQHYWWAKKFYVPDFQRAVMGERITVRDCQRMFEDVIEYAVIKKQLESEEDIRLVEPDENLKRKTNCGGCGDQKRVHSTVVRTR